jgi:beta-xylosidase
MAAAVVLAAILPAAVRSTALAAPPRTATVGPAPVLAHGGDFPDPHVLVAGGVYYAYSTNVARINVPVMTSTDLTPWTATAEALPPLASWASPGRTWAPTAVPKGGAYVLYYTVTQTATRPQLDRGGSIDPCVFTDSNSARLSFVNGKPTLA